MGGLNGYLRCCRRAGRVLRSVFVVLLLTSATRPCAAAEATPGEPCPTPSAAVIGWAEQVRLIEVGIEQKARIDTGAGLAAIDADIIEIRKNARPSGPDRVIFTIDDGKGGRATLNRDIVDWVKIKNKGTNGSTARPVVIMKLCIAGKTIVDRMTLAQRHDFIYPILIGRNWLVTGGFLVDSGISFTHTPGCEP